MIEIDAHITSVVAGDEAGIDQGGGSQFVPHNVGAGGEHGELRDVTRNRGAGGLDLLDQSSGHFHFDGNIGRGADNLVPRSAQDDGGCLGIEPEIEFMARIVEKLRIVAVGADASTHKDEIFREVRELRINRDGKREIGHWATFVNCDLMGILMDHPDDEMRSVFLRWLGGGLALRHLRNYRGLVPPTIIPGSGVSDLSELKLPELGFVAGANERKLCTGNYGNIGASDDLEQAERVGDFLVEPLISTDHSDA